jgi:hypothetical protein
VGLAVREAAQGTDGRRAYFYVADFCLQVPHIGRKEYTLIDVNDEGFVSAVLTCSFGLQISHPH